ncbi:uncharacterized protein LOC114828230 [Galendromus occidentalis]|uniref:Uncharacterized protein LOC114828230 n=1 Tax=Galendromus occidentalis TaxID=34638 RepID=A0AAJ7WHN3_9ACAR|nr:uncharacterized protein LOC114828230 [Galendromus occidentalis]
MADAATTATNGGDPTTKPSFRCPETCNYDTPEMPTFEEFCSSAPIRTTRASEPPAGTQRHLHPQHEEQQVQLQQEKPPVLVQQLEQQQKQQRQAELQQQQQPQRDQERRPQQTPHQQQQQKPPDPQQRRQQSLQHTQLRPQQQKQPPAPPQQVHNLQQQQLQQPSKHEANSGKGTEVKLPVEQKSEGYLKEFEELTRKPPRLRAGEEPDGLPLATTFCNASLEERRNIWDRLWELDKKACETVCQMEKLFDRFDCNLRYSVRWSCKHCLDSYREWTCAMRLPIFHPMTGALWKPCRSICTDVEERCPHFHPIQGEAYAGEPLFYCIDPNIAEPENKSLFASSDRCYMACWLKENPKARLPEIFTNSDMATLISPTNRDETTQASIKVDLNTVGRNENQRDELLETTPAPLPVDVIVSDTNTESVDGDNTTDRDSQGCPAIDWLQEDPSLKSISTENRVGQSLTSAAISFRRAHQPRLWSMVWIGVGSLLLGRSSSSKRSLFCVFCGVVGVVFFSSSFCSSSGRFQEAAT